MSSVVCTLRTQLTLFPVHWVPVCMSIMHMHNFRLACLCSVYSCNQRKAVKKTVIFLARNVCRDHGSGRGSRSFESSQTAHATVLELPWSSRHGGLTSRTQQAKPTVSLTPSRGASKKLFLCRFDHYRSNVHMCLACVTTRAVGYISR